MSRDPKVRVLRFAHVGGSIEEEGKLRMLAELEYVSVGCSRTPHAADWSESGIVAYAANDSVALARESEVRQCLLPLASSRISRSVVVSGRARSREGVRDAPRAQRESQLRPLGPACLPLAFR